MRLGVLDVGSNTVHMLVVDAHRGGMPLPAWSEKYELRLAEVLEPSGHISDDGIERLVDAVAQSKVIAERFDCGELIPFATSAVREAKNAEAVLALVADKTGVELEVLPGNDEARLTFLAVRRWFGWSAGQVLGLDIGGGSLEVALGRDETPDFAVSLPLGAGRLTWRFLGHDDVPDEQEVEVLRTHVVSHLVRVAHDVRRFVRPDLVVGSSKTFRTLARIAGAAPSSEGPYVKRFLERERLGEIVQDLMVMPVSERVSLPGVSASRARQLLAGAIVAFETMSMLDIETMAISPWALREGVILEHLDQLNEAEMAVPAIDRDDFE